MCKKYNIKKDDVYPYDAEKSEEILSKYKIEIQKSCTDKTSLTAEYDAQNILWVESKRGDCSNNLFDTNFEKYAIVNGSATNEYQKAVARRNYNLSISAQF